MAMNILFTAFKGKNNSSAILLDKITGDKLYLTNSYVGLAKEINHLEQIYDVVQMFAYGLYGIICVVAALFVWKLVPETKGKTLEDMTKLWKNRRNNR